MILARAGGLRIVMLINEMFKKKKKNLSNMAMNNENKERENKVEAIRKDRKLKSAKLKKYISKSLVFLIYDILVKAVYS